MWAPRGKGGKYLILPPDFTGEVPTGYIVAHSKTDNTFSGIRSILASNSEEGERAGNALVAQIKVYTSAKADSPPAQRFVDMTDTMYTRGVAFTSFLLPPAKLGAGSFYLGALFDSEGEPLRGENTYRLHVPSSVSVSQFWALTVYNTDTQALFANWTRPTVGSLDGGMCKNADGSVDLYVGPKAPAGQEANWIYTPAGKSWFPWFRFQGPEKALFDKSGKMPDIEQLK